MGLTLSRVDIGASPSGLASSSGHTIAGSSRVPVTLSLTADPALGTQPHRFTILTNLPGPQMPTLNAKTSKCPSVAMVELAVARRSNARSTDSNELAETEKCSETAQQISHKEIEDRRIQVGQQHFDASFHLQVTLVGQI
ncbi:unnamed protein product [Protopolystoma xenopodis]|uniref:Uncharacterized protein n=1 Tax=Protopolystoma xenopodis TaxID=117903 RepID=A0A3S5BKA1_9PLAT|nr:unnamed protein product [Protopolystoma xenopodis]